LSGAPGCADAPELVVAAEAEGVGPAPAELLALDPEHPATAGTVHTSTAPAARRTALFLEFRRDMSTFLSLHIDGACAAQAKG
jgi:hypothetical protein